MKYILSLAMLALITVSCQKKDDGGGSAPPPVAAPAPSSDYATTPQPCNLNTPGCGQNGYQNYGNLNNWYYGQWYFPYNYNPNYQNCGCPMNYSLVYSSGYGVACAPQMYFQYYAVTYYNYNWWNGPPQNTQYNNIPQFSYAGPNAACMNQAYTGCVTNPADPRSACPAGLRCQPVAGGSYIGLCVQ